VYNYRITLFFTLSIIYMYKYCIICVMRVGERFVTMWWKKKSDPLAAVSTRARDVIAVLSIVVILTVWSTRKKYYAYITLVVLTRSRIILLCMRVVYRRSTEEVAFLQNNYITTYYHVQVLEWYTRDAYCSSTFRFLAKRRVYWFFFLMKKKKIN